MLKLFARIVTALTIGLILSLWVIQNSSSVKKMVTTKLIHFIEQEWNTHLDIDSVKINFFTFSVFLQNGKVRPSDKKNYAWQCDQCHIYVSPINLLLKKKISLYLTFNNLKAATGYDNGSVGLIDHISDIFTPKSPDANIAARALTINNIELTATSPNYPDRNVTLHAPGTFHITKEKVANEPHQYSWYGSLVLENATIMHNHELFAKNINGTTSFYKEKSNGTWHLASLLQGALQLLNPTDTYTLEGAWSPNHRSLMLKDQSSVTNLTAMLTQASSLALKGHLPIALITRVVQFATTGKLQASSLLPTSAGSCSVNVLMQNQENRLATIGNVSCSDLQIANLNVQNMALNFVDKLAQNSSPAADIMSPHADLQASLSWDYLSNSGALTLTNTAPLAAPTSNATVATYAPLGINPHDLKVTVSCDQERSLKGTYRCIVTNQATEKKHIYKGALLLNSNHVGVKGSSTKGDYLVKAALTPQPRITYWRYTIGKKHLINITQSPQDPMILQGSVRWAFMRSFLEKSMRRFIFNNNCSFNITLNQHDLHNLQGSVRMTEGRFFIPDYHNLIQNINIDVSVDLSAKKLLFDNVSIGLSKGSITCPRATVLFNHDYSINMIHAPFSIDNMFINWKRDFYGFVYGNLLLNKLPDATANLSGSIVLKKSLLKDTFFAQDMNSTVYGPMSGGLTLATLPLGLNIKLTTENPIKAKTPSISAAATLDLLIRSTPSKDFCSAPYVTGTVNLDGGHLKFFHNKLYIDYGKIQCVSQHMNDPMIDLVAKNRIGKYMVCLQATGSLLKPTIVLESTPDLPEEQILGLLLTGSDEATLQTDLLSMLMQNLDSFIFDNRKNSKATAWFDRLSKTLKYVQITPNLTDEANPKLKGSISVSLTDQLHAHIQKNFDLENDFSAQLEYMLSDEINLKVVKDQHGELGSEVEMRLKLG